MKVTQTTPWAAVSPAQFTDTRAERCAARLNRGSSGDLFTMTETKQRLRNLAAAARIAEDAPVNAPVEIGLRALPIALDHVDPSTSLYADGDDDLDDFYSVREASHLPDVRREGAIVHLYVYRVEHGNWRDLLGVVIAWMGTATEPARLVQIGGQRIVPFVNPWSGHVMWGVDTNEDGE